MPDMPNLTVDVPHAHVSHTWEPTRCPLITLWNAAWRRTNTEPKDIKRSPTDWTWSKSGGGLYVKGRILISSSTVGIQDATARQRETLSLFDWNIIASRHSRGNDSWIWGFLNEPEVRNALHTVETCAVWLQCALENMCGVGQDLSTSCQGCSNHR